MPTWEMALALCAFAVRAMKGDAFMFHVQQVTKRNDGWLATPRKSTINAGGLSGGALTNGRDSGQVKVHLPRVPSPGEYKPRGNIWPLRASEEVEDEDGGDTPVPMMEGMPEQTLGAGGGEVESPPGKSQFWETIVTDETSATPEMPPVFVGEREATGFHNTGIHGAGSLNGYTVEDHPDQYGRTARESIDCSRWRISNRAFLAAVSEIWDDIAKRSATTERIPSGSEQHNDHTLDSSASCDPYVTKETVEEAMGYSMAKIMHDALSGRGPSKAKQPRTGASVDAFSAVGPNAASALEEAVDIAMGRMLHDALSGRHPSDTLQPRSGDSKDQEASAVGSKKGASAEVEKGSSVVQPPAAQKPRERWLSRLWRGIRKRPKS